MITALEIRLGVYGAILAAVLGLWAYVHHLQTETRVLNQKLATAEATNTVSQAQAGVAQEAAQVVDRGAQRDRSTFTTHTENARALQPLLALARLSLSISMLLAATGCAGMPRTAMTLAALNCKDLIPSSYRKPVQGTPLPAAEANAGQLWTSLDDQTGRLDQANGRTSDVVELADRCQARQDALLKALTPTRPWWKIW